jgi:hypothetical protein
LDGLLNINGSTPKNALCQEKSASGEKAWTGEEITREQEVMTGRK